MRRLPDESIESRSCEARTTRGAGTHNQLTKIRLGTTGPRTRRSEESALSRFSSWRGYLAARHPSRQRVSLQTQLVSKRSQSPDDENQQGSRATKSQSTNPTQTCLVKRGLRPVVKTTSKRSRCNDTERSSSFRASQVTPPQCSAQRCGPLRDHRGVSCRVPSVRRSPWRPPPARTRRRGDDRRW